MTTKNPRTLTDEQLAELERLMAGAWRAPWTARTFEIDCPCPNGDDCGNLHDCAEVESREDYPASPEEPAEEGHGQCVVQIQVPGLEEFALANAQAIAAMRNAYPALLAEVRASRAASRASPEALPTRDARADTIYRAVRSGQWGRDEVSAYLAEYDECGRASPEEGRALRGTMEQIAGLSSAITGTYRQPPLARIHDVATAALRSPPAPPAEDGQPCRCGRARQSAEGWAAQGVFEDLPGGYMLHHNRDEECEVVPPAEDEGRDPVDPKEIMP